MKFRILIAATLFSALSYTAAGAQQSNNPYWPLGQSEADAVSRVVQDTLARDPEIALRALAQSYARDRQQDKQLRNISIQRLAARAKDMLDSNDPRIIGEGVPVQLILSLNNCRSCTAALETARRMASQEGGVRFFVHDVANPNSSGGALLKTADRAVSEGKYWEFRSALSDAYQSEEIQSSETPIEDALKSATDEIGLEYQNTDSLTQSLDMFSILLGLGETKVPAIVVGDQVAVNMTGPDEIRRFIKSVSEASKSSSKEK